MRFVPRTDAAAPGALGGLGKDGRTELERARDHQAAGAADSFPFAVYKADEVKLRLEKLFHGKCAYCETVYASSAPVDVEHYRPKGRVEGVDGHPGYWWLAMDWDNLLPSCIDCNRRRRQKTPKGDASLAALDRDARDFRASAVVQSGKKDAFPVSGVHARTEEDDLALEGALLLNPCRDDPAEHIHFHVGREQLIGLVLPKAGEAGGDQMNGSVRGAVSIQVYGLNRLGLVQERTRVLRQLDFLETLVVELGGIADDLEATGGATSAAMVRRLRTLQDMILERLAEMAAPTAPYSAMVAAWMAAFRARLSS